MMIAFLLAWLPLLSLLPTLSKRLASITTGLAIVHRSIT